MARTLPSPLQVARNRLRQELGWLTFLEIPLQTGVLRMVHNEEHLDANGVRWAAASLKIEFPPEDSEGSIGQLSVSVSNVSRLPIAYVEVDGEILGRTVTVWIQHASALAAFEANLSWSFVVLEAEMNELLARFTCGHPSELLLIPGPLFNRGDFPQLLRSGGFNR